MDFRTINHFNVIMNAISGNFLPTSGEKMDLSIVCKIYLIFTWIIEAIYQLSTTIGTLFYVPAIVAVRDGGVSLIVSVEMMVFVPYLTHRSDRLREIISKINNLLVDSDVMRRCIRESVEPHKKRLTIIVITTISSVALWGALPMIKLMEGNKNSYYYTDFTMPTYYPGAPFTPDVFFWGILMESIGGAYLIGKKSSIDLYVIYIITLLIAQYRYVHDELTTALDHDNDEKNEEHVIDTLKKCVRHHCITIEIGQMVNELLSITIGLTYLNCILRFCFVGFGVITLPDIQDKIIYIMYGAGTIIQVYVLCLCVQELLDASTTVTDDAFHGDWYERGKTVKNIFRTMGLGNKMECRLNAFRIVDLTVPTFSSMLNGAYTACLLLLSVY